MKVSVIIPVWNEEKNLPALFRALQAQLAQAEEILFVDNGSSDAGPALLQAWAANKPKVKILREAIRGFAPPLNTGVRAALGDTLVFLDADAEPAARWLKEMKKSLSRADLVVGETISTLPPKPSVYGKLGVKLFQSHSKNTATANGHALPWGPTCNLGVRKEWFEKAGLFSPAAEGAFDIDWCWRAVLSGAKLEFAEKAVVKHQRRNDRQSLLEQFRRYGRGEAWIRRSFAFLLEENEKIEPLDAALAAFRRLRHGSRASGKKSWAAELEEVALAFGLGVQEGFEKMPLPCPERREAPRQAVGWKSGKNSRTVFVAGKGVTTFQGKMSETWEAWRDGLGREGLEKRFRKLFRAGPEEARHLAEEFIDALTPVGSWKKLS
jgi:glycosyltransferase involved in cell wall biosynthesis